MPPTNEQITQILKTIKYPGFNRDIVAFGLVKGVQIEQDTVTVHLHLTTADPQIPQTLRQQATEALLQLPGIASVHVEVQVTAPVTAAMQAGGLPQEPIPGIRRIIAVGSGKGGVGKSTVAANLALALQLEGLRVGLCDCDIYGPSIALMFGTHEAPYATEDNRIVAIEQYGLKLMSMGFLLSNDAPAILRGPMVTRYTQQFLRNVEWGELDYLILDLPPGTGDIQLTIVQTVALAGAVVVTTPQEVALIDARKAVAMFEKVNVPVLGIIENMSYFLCPNDGNRYDIFGSGGGLAEAQRLQVPLLAEIPLEIALRVSGDSGKPLVLAQPTAPTTQAFRKAARQLMETTGKM
jgi:ATP-binding protein involved in chromosome partitioning